MEKQLSDVPFTIKNGRCSNIGKNNNEHFQNLESVLDMLKKMWFATEKEKMCFYAI